VNRLYDKHRPTSLADVVGQPKACASLKRLFDGNSVGGQAFFIAGASGTGKSTLGRIIAGELADPFFVETAIGRECTPKAIAKWQDAARLTAWGRGGRAFIVEEAHGLGKASIEAFLDWLERLPRHCVVIFTTTKDGAEQLFEEQIDAHPLLSRCIALRLTNQGLAEPFAELAQRIALAEGLDGQPLAAYKRLVQRCKNNMREVLQAIAAGEMVQS
jgi:replication-associated recombination protein RarA